MAKTQWPCLWTRVVSSKIDIEGFAFAYPLIGAFAEIGGSVISLVGTAEKGYLDTKLTVMTPGGHSSVPPPHTVKFSVS